MTEIDFVHATKSTIAKIDYTTCIETLTIQLQASKALRLKIIQTVILPLLANSTEKFVYKNLKYLTQYWPYISVTGRQDIKHFVCHLLTTKNFDGKTTSSSRLFRNALVLLQRWIAHKVFESTDITDSLSSCILLQKCSSVASKFLLTLAQKQIDEGNYSPWSDLIESWVLT